MVDVATRRPGVRQRFLTQDGHAALRGLNGGGFVEGGWDDHNAEVCFDCVERGAQLCEALTFIQTQKVTCSGERRLAYIDEPDDLEPVAELRHDAPDPF